MRPPAAGESRVTPFEVHRAAQPVQSRPMRRSAWLALTLVPLSSLAAPASPTDVSTLFSQWRAFQRPSRVDGVPDYSPKAMAAQAKALPGWLKRVNELVDNGAPLPLRTDVRLYRQEWKG